MRSAKYLFAFGVILAMFHQTAFAQGDSAPSSSLKPQADAAEDYILGPEDQISVWVADSEEFANKVYRISGTGKITLPMVGTFQAAGLTTRELSDALSKSLYRFLKDPQVVVGVTDYHSQPVSIVGAVNTPGVQQLRGRKTLLEIISLAGGLRQDAGNVAKITREAVWGPIPITGATKDPSGTFSVADINLNTLIAASHPVDNIVVRPHDVISVPRAEMVYVIGEVERSGGHLLSDRSAISVLQALSMAGGLRSTAAPNNARILREQPGSSKREEIKVDLPKILSATASDVPLQPNDVLFIPNSRSKRAALRAAEATIQTLTGVVIWRSAR